MESRAQHQQLMNTCSAKHHNDFCTLLRTARHHRKNAAAHAKHTNTQPQSNNRLTVVHMLTAQTQSHGPRHRPNTTSNTACMELGTRSQTNLGQRAVGKSLPSPLLAFKSAYRHFFFARALNV